MGAQGFLDRIAAALGGKRPPVDLRADTWRPGELAECVDDNWHEQMPRLPKVREILRVVAVEDHVVAGHRDWWLGFSGFPANHYFAAVAFRKVVPADESFEASIRRIRPATKKARTGRVFPMDQCSAISGEDPTRGDFAFLAGTGAMTFLAIGKRRAGRLLDGVQHDGVPA